MSTTLEQIKAAMVEVDKTPEAGDIKVWVLRANDVLCLLPKLIAEVEAKDRAVELLRSLNGLVCTCRNYPGCLHGIVKHTLFTLDTELKAL